MARCLHCGRELFSDKEMIFRTHVAVQEAMALEVTERSPTAWALVASIARNALDNAKGLCLLGECRRKRLGS